ncbi:MAG: TetR family transcriptional regulator [Firmicutes bacterium]|nr:TetR family transcriptional regulator [Bacillota bacterium]
MPSDTFLKLSKEKQNSLIESAILEFSENTYNEASINKIINRIKLPRGSFYMYFNDKYDLYTYILKTYLNRFEEMQIELLKKTNGDFIKMNELLYNKIILFIKKDKNQKLLNNLFKEIRFSTERNLFKPQNIENQKEQIINLINKDLYEFNNKEDLFDAYMFTISTTIGAITHYFLEINNKHEKEIYLKRLHIIKYGIKKKEGK